MSAKQAGKLIVIFTVAFLVTSSMLVLVGDEGSQRTWDIDPVAGTISHKIVGTDDVVNESSWLPEGDVEVGLTAGASTPNNKISDTIERILATHGLEIDELFAEY